MEGDERGGVNVETENSERLFGVAEESEEELAELDESKEREEETWL